MTTGLSAATVMLALARSAARRAISLRRADCSDQDVVDLAIRHHLGLSPIFWQVMPWRLRSASAPASGLLWVLCAGGWQRRRSQAA
jgi:hypothetical protein